MQKAIVLSLSLILAGGALSAHEEAAKPKAAAAAAAKEHWVCPMHDGGESDHAGKCPKCGMDLVKEEEEAPKFKASIDPKGAKESAYPSLAKLSFQQAVATAFGEIKGVVLEYKAELENENGLIYSVEAKLADGSEIEVNVDAGTGKVLEVEKKAKGEQSQEDKD